MSFDGHIIVYHSRKIHQPGELLSGLFALLNVERCTSVLVLENSGDHYSERVVLERDNVKLQTICEEILPALSPWHCLSLAWWNNKPDIYARVVSEIREAIPPEIMDNWIPEVGYIVTLIGPHLYDNVLERDAEPGYPYGYIRTEFAFEFFTEVGCPTDWSLARSLIFSRPSLINFKSALEKIVGPCEQYAFWYG